MLRESQSKQIAFLAYNWLAPGTEPIYASNTGVSSVLGRWARFYIYKNHHFCSKIYISQHHFISCHCTHMSFKNSRITYVIISNDLPLLGIAHPQQSYGIFEIYKTIWLYPSINMYAWHSSSYLARLPNIKLRQISRQRLHLYIIVNKKTCMITDMYLYIYFPE